MFSRTRAGITFVEVVVVLVIATFVVAVLFPIFYHPISRSRLYRSACVSNMKQLGLAMTQYEQDADGGLPMGTTPAGNGWAGQIYPFVKVTGVYHCPADVHDSAYLSYAENRNLVKHTLNDLSTPAATVEFYEFTTLNCDPTTAEAVSGTGLTAPQDSKRHDQPNFQYGLNFLAVDGHAKFLTPEKVSGGPGAVRAKALPQGAYVETFAVK